MKKELSMLLVFSCLAIFANAQSPRVYTIPQEKLRDTPLLNRFKSKAFVDSLKNNRKYWQTPYNNLPLAGSMPRRFNYLGNNRQGFDIYQTPQDNMYILKPDSSFASNMPIAEGQNSTYKPVDMPNHKKEKKD